MTICTNCYPQAPVVNAGRFQKFLKVIIITVLFLLFAGLIADAASPKGSGQEPTPVRNSNGTSLNGNEYRRLGNKLLEKAQENFASRHGSITQVNRPAFLKYQTDMNLGLYDKKEMLDALTKAYDRRAALEAWKALELSEREFINLLIH